MSDQSLVVYVLIAGTADDFRTMFPSDNVGGIRRWMIGHFEGGNCAIGRPHVGMVNPLPGVFKKARDITIVVDCCRERVLCALYREYNQAAVRFSQKS